MNRRYRTPGISRIDQPSHHTHGFFIRVRHKHRTLSAFFSDKKYGGKGRAFLAAQFYHEGLRLKFGLTGARLRRRNAEVVRRKGRSGILGVRRVIIRRARRRPWKYWAAHWSPLPGVYRKKQFSIRKYGEKKAKALAIKARRDGVRNMK
jgi:hypothetical protein